MKILVIEGSPHRKGSSNMLAEEFMRGAVEAGHDVTVFDAGHADLHPCLGCDKCKEPDIDCVRKDDVAVLRREAFDCDMIVFATPLYYFGFSAQIKMAIDRFYGYNTEFRERHIKAALLSAAGDTEEWTFDALKLHFDTICRYMHFENCGSVLALGCYTTDDTSKSRYLKDAYEFGLSL